ILSDNLESSLRIMRKLFCGTRPGLARREPHACKGRRRHGASPAGEVTHVCQLTDRSFGVALERAAIGNQRMNQTETPGVGPGLPDTPDALSPDRRLAAGVRGQ
ncbi:hypothetical protein R5H32_06425, partial [Defluviimonas sp. D31]|uniref:hypothetical protein n=1 Tax=Defluviimonas sp. D31 TaxID=3083253 RepID=UPI00296F0AF4